jgi:hypothetical protein
MSISSRTYDNERKRRKPFFALSRGVGAFAIAITLLAAGGGFALISPTPMTAALAQEENNTTASATISNTTTTTSAASSSGIELSPELVYQERSREVGEIPINQTDIQVTFSGNGTINLPNSTETIMTTSIGSGISSFIDGTFAGKEILTTEDGSENATATVYEIGQFNMQDGTGRGIAIAVFHTNSTGKLAPLDGMILTGQDEFLPDGSAFITFWEWQSGIP